jgi:hypothetical protein
VRVVRVHDVGLHCREHARELPGGVKVEFAFRPERHEPQAFLAALRRALRELAALVGDEHGRMAELAEARDGQQHLILAATPRAGGVNVNG